MKKHPYILATIVATLLAVVVWLLTPKEYTAITTVSDEYEEVDLAIGLNQLKAHIRNLMHTGNTGINDIETYHKILLTEDFVRDIAHKHIPESHTTYGEYIGETDTIEEISKHINYNFHSKSQTLTISFTDHSPLIAAQMLDSVVAQLQAVVTDHRHQLSQAALHNAEEKLKTAKEAYTGAQRKYAVFKDSHIDIHTQAEKQAEEALKNDMEQHSKYLDEVSNEYARQKALLQRSYLSFATIQSNHVPDLPNSTFVGYLLSFLLIALALTHVVVKYRDGQFRHRPDWGNIFSPWAITLLIWCAILGLYYLLDTDLYPITSQFYYCLSLWVPIFCLCSLTVYHMGYDKKTPIIPASDFRLNKKLFDFFFVISLFITPLYLYRIITIVMMFSTEDLMTNVRTLALFGDGYGILNYSSVINQSLFVVALWAYPRIPKWKVAVLALACMLNALAIMEKGSMLFVVLCFIFVLFEKKIIHTRAIALTGLAIIVVFYAFNLARAGQDSDYQKEETLLDFFAMYVLSPPVAFCQLLKEVTPQFGTNTFETIYLFLRRFGMDDIVVKEKLQEFVFVPIGTNVYTIFQPFYIDFGYKGIALFAGVYGCVCGWLYRLYKNGDSTGYCLYTYAVYVLILQFYQENVFLSMVFVLQFAFFVTLMTQQHISVSLKPRTS